MLFKERNREGVFPLGQIALIVIASAAFGFFCRYDFLSSFSLLAACFTILFCICSSIALWRNRRNLSELHWIPLAYSFLIFVDTHCFGLRAFDPTIDELVNLSAYISPVFWWVLIDLKKLEENIAGILRLVTFVPVFVMLWVGINYVLQTDRENLETLNRPGFRIQICSEPGKYLEHNIKVYEYRNVLPGIVRAELLYRIGESYKPIKYSIDGGVLRNSFDDSERVLPSEDHTVSVLDVFFTSSFK